MNIKKDEFLEKIIDLIEFHGFTAEESSASVRLREDLNDLIYQYRNLNSESDNYENYDWRHWDKIVGWVIYATCISNCSKEQR